MCACYHPLTAYYSKDINPSGKRSLVFNANQALDPRRSISIPCGRCIGCRLEYSRQWAIRCVLESKLYDSNYFVTLTYDDVHLPADGSLQPDDLQKFFKRLRRYLSYHELSSTIRFFACGEYGEKFSRPHYHAIIFNFKIPDLRLFGHNFDSSPVYVSDILSRIWAKGFVLIGSVTFESCAYVARYVTKKITGDNAEEHYNGREPEFVRMSRRPGIAMDWLTKYRNDVYPHDYLVIRNGVKVKPPKYFDRVLERIDPDELEQIKEVRSECAFDSLLNELHLRNINVSLGNRYHSSKDVARFVYESDVLPVKEECAVERGKRLKRGYENPD